MKNKKNNNNVIYTDGQKIEFNGDHLYISRRNPRVKTVILSVVILLLLVIILGVLIRSCSKQVYDNMTATPDEQSVEWNGEQNISNPHAKSYVGSYIPGFDTLYLVANTKNQKVNFYNPESNNCYFKMYLYIDDRMVWQSEFVKPGRGFYDITLSREYQPCNTTGYLKIECYSLDAVKLTKTVNIKFNVEIY